MAELQALQKNMATLLYKQLSQYFAQIKILSYKPSADGTISGKFLGDRLNYNFIIKGQQVQYLPIATSNTLQPQVKQDALSNAVVSCSGTNHPCKGEKGTRCVPRNQSCKQREASEEGLARLKEIGDTSKQITSIVLRDKSGASDKGGELGQSKEESSDKFVEPKKDISLYDFLKYYAPLNPKMSQGFDKAKMYEVRKKGIKTQSESSSQSKEKPRKENSSQIESSVTKTESTAKTDPKDPYDFLGVDRKQFKNEKELYTAAKQAYKSLAQKYHPDKGGNPEMMQKLNEMMDKLRKLRKDSLIRRSR